MRTVLFSLMCVFLVLFSCKTSKKSEDGAMSGLRYGMEKGACFGYCPIYTLKIDTKGKAVWDAKRFNKSNGKFERKLSNDEFTKLKDAFAQTKLFEMQDEYPTMVADLPMTVLIETNKGIIKRVKGNEKMPAAYENTVSLMENIVNSGTWALLEKYEDDAPRNLPKEEENILSEIIIEPNEGIRLPLWFKEKEELGIRLVRKISPENNLWLITYDNNLIEPRMMLAMLKKDPAIKNAEFNKKNSPR